MAEMRAVMRQAAEEMGQWVAGCFGQKPRGERSGKKAWHLITHVGMRETSESELVTPRFFFTDASLLLALLQY
jgi:hypothetical protein